MKKTLLVAAILAASVSGSAMAAGTDTTEVKFNTTVYGNGSILLNSSGDIEDGIGFYNRKATNKAEISIGRNDGGLVNLNIAITDGGSAELVNGGSEFADLKYSVDGSPVTDGGNNFDLTDQPTHTKIEFNPEFEDNYEDFVAGDIEMTTTITATCA